MLSSPTKKVRAKTLSGHVFYAAPKKRRFRGRHLFVILLIVAVGFGAYRKVYRPKGNPPLRRVPVATAGAVSKSVEVPHQAAAAPKAESSDPFEIRRMILRSGDTLEGILKASGIPGGYLEAWRNVCKPDQLDRINENDELILVLNRADGLPVEVAYLRSHGTSFTLRKNSTGWECGFDNGAAGWAGKTVKGSWSEHFHDSSVAGGLPAPLISNAADIFAYDVDFASDLKDGDSFSIFYQEYPIRSSEGKQFLILAAETSVSGKVYQAFGFQLPDGSWDYFDVKGASLKRTFLKSPVNNRLLWSGKTAKGVSPVVRVLRPRLGIRYLVPKGTPVTATGDGFVSAIRKDSGRNFSIEIRHRGGYSTVYGNISACSRGLKRGSPVSQAEIIGFVGLSGGGKAYFDFHLYKDGKPVNFQTAEFARSKSVPKTAVQEFEKSRDFCAAALHGSTPEGQKHEMLSGRDW